MLFWLYEKLHYTATIEKYIKARSIHRYNHYIHRILPSFQEIYKLTKAVNTRTNCLFKHSIDYFK